MSGEEVFLRGLYELSSAENQHKISRNVFGLDQSRQSKAFGAFIYHVFDGFQHLVTDNLDWWQRNGFFELSAEAIGRKLGIPENLVGFFIDCKCSPSRVVGGGPAEEGANSARWSKLIQQAFFNGWKSVHGLKHQTLDNAYGITVDMHGPTSLRRNDLILLRDSDINGRLEAVQQRAGVPAARHVIAFGDSAYHPLSHLHSYFSIVALRVRGLTSPDEIEYFKEWNFKMKTVRISIEWNYGVTGSLFRYVSTPDKL
jgi:hypothetical protein